MNAATMTRTSAPERSLAQRLEALQNANRIRTFRAAVKRDVKAGKTDARALLRWPPDELDSMKVWDLLVAIPKLGRVKVNRLLARERISPSKTVGGLTMRQRLELAALLHSKAAVQGRVPEEEPHER